jgi:hypothetical protein
MPSERPRGLDFELLENGIYGIAGTFGALGWRFKVVIWMDEGNELMTWDHEMVERDMAGRLEYQKRV